MNKQTENTQATEVATEESVSMSFTLKDFMSQVLRIKKVYESDGKLAFSLLELNTKSFKKDGNWVNPTAIKDDFIVIMAEKFGVPAKIVHKSPTSK
jgi:hypothetical protein